MTRWNCIVLIFILFFLLFLPYKTRIKLRDDVLEKILKELNLI